MSDKRSVHTDALATLGTLNLDETAGRDAIHLAVEPIIAGERLYPGDHVGIRNGKAYKNDVKLIGIVDPFLDTPDEDQQRTFDAIKKGEKFWLVIYPRTIKSLRHVWSHSDIPDTIETVVKEFKTQPGAEESEAWIKSFADNLGQTYEELMEAAEKWEKTEDYTYDNSETYKSHQGKFEEFWKHYENVTGRKVKDHSSFFTCSC